MALSSAAWAQSTPIPVGPIILWPEKAMKSAPSAVTSTGAWGTSWAPSTRTSAPALWAAAAISATGLMVPKTLDMADTPTNFTPCNKVARSVRSRRPSPSRGR